MNPGGLFVSSSGRVGIGTINPSYTFQVSGSIAAIGPEYGLYFQRTTGTPSDLYSWSADSSTAYLYNHTSSSILLTINETGKVGIGTSIPDLALSVSGAINVRNSTRAGAIEIDSSGNLWLGTATTAGNIYLETGHSTTGLPSTGTARLTLNSSGATFSSTVTASGIVSSEDVRIYRSAGTTTGYINFGSTGTNYFGWDGSKFAFNGSLSAVLATFSSRLGVGISSDQNYASIFVGGDVTVGVNQYAIITDPQLSGTSNSYALFANARIKANTAVTNAFGVYISSAEKISGATITNNYALYIANQTSGASVNYSIYSSGGLNYFGGNVGIGISSPQTPLHINAASGDNTLLIQALSTAYSQIFLGRAASGSPSYAGYIQYYHVNDSLTIGTNATPRITISSTGAITISTPTSGQTLSINGKNNNWTQEVIGSSTTGQSYGLLITAGTNSSDSSFVIQNQAGNTNYFKVRGDGYLQSQSTYNNTTATAANLSISTSGFIERSTSSIKYKKDVRNYDKGLAEVLQMRPVYYKGIGKNDGDKQFAGLIAEEIHDLELTEFVQYAEDGSPDALAYQNMIALLTKAIQELKAEVDTLKAQ
jgi:hypothetical protein